MSITFVRADASNVVELAGSLRAADVLEIRDGSGMTPEASLWLSTALSAHVWAVLEDGRTIGMFGVAPVRGKPGVGSPWMLGSERLARNVRAYVSHSRKFITQMLAEFPLLENFVDARNTAAIRWLRWCGFQLAPAVPYGVSGQPFHPFFMERPGNV